MSNSKKLLQAAAGAAGGGLNVEEVFSTYLYESTGTTQTITNDIDLSGEGGMVWFKRRNLSSNHRIYDTERGMTAPTGGAPYLYTNDTAANLGTGFAGSVVATSSGFDITGTGIGDISDNGGTYASWTFRKAPKFFDILTTTLSTGTNVFTAASTGTVNGDGTVTIPHSLGSTPGSIWIKATNQNLSWRVWHRSATNDLILNESGAQANNYFGNVGPTSFDLIDNGFMGNSKSNYNFVIYLFAHNDGDGDFGPDGDADIIKCGSYTGDGAVGNQVTLGFEPQWLLIKRTSGTGNWILLDNMRGIPTESSALTDSVLKPNKSDAEALDKHVNLDATGFILNDTGTLVNGSGDDYIYIAIRRGPMAVPEDATDVFAIDTFGSGPPAFTSNFPVDFALYRNVDGVGNNFAVDRLRGATVLRTNLTDADAASSPIQFDYNDGYYDSAATDSTFYSWMWRRAPNYFDVVAYTGNGTAGRTVSHNLGVAPEMMWVKSRNAVRSWSVYHSALGATKGGLGLNLTSAASTDSTVWNDTEPTDTQFTVGTYGNVNTSGNTYIAYLFASLDGVSKVGSYTGNGTAGHQIDCGFTSGARFVLIKSTSSGRSWIVHDTERGIVAGNDPYLKLDTTDAEQSDFDVVDAYSSGFIVNEYSNWNANGETYIFYAIA